MENMERDLSQRYRAETLLFCIVEAPGCMLWPTLSDQLQSQRKSLMGQGEEDEPEKQSIQTVIMVAKGEDRYEGRAWSDSRSEKIGRTQIIQLEGQVHKSHSGRAWLLVS